MEFVAQQIDHSNANKNIEWKKERINVQSIKTNEDDMVVFNDTKRRDRRKKNGEITTCYSLQIQKFNEINATRILSS